MSRTTLRRVIIWIMIWCMGGMINALEASLSAGNGLLAVVHAMLGWIYVVSTETTSPAMVVATIIVATTVSTMIGGDEDG